ncbi:three-helix bundle dimerization domain-containing protein [Agromyces sp. ZXT2-6]|uniref:three-helix bundle dimerization domain-containing protein n=1 Tax=Agromyces sp. ZXT2-6 TaxID=3461153 RepID=UPI004054EDD6
MTEDGQSRELDEQQGVQQVIDRLSERFPDIDRARIAEIVDEEHHTFDGRKVRDFVPVLVEKSAKRRVKALAAT